MRMILLVCLSFFTQRTLASEIVGFLLNEQRAFPAFTIDNKVWRTVNQKDLSAVSGNTFEIFFDQKNLGELTVTGPSKECFRKYTAEETKKTKNCPKFEFMAPVAANGPCPGDLGAKMACPKNPGQNVEVKVIDGMNDVKISKEVLSVLKRPMSSKTTNFEWGVLSEVRPKLRPLLLTQTKVSDPEKWAPVEFSKIPAEIQKQILDEVLSHRKTQKCELQASKVQSITLTEKDLLVGKSYQNMSGNKFAVAVKIKEVPGLMDCNANEMGVPSAYVIYDGKKALDVLHKQEWNYRELELLEAADVNADGVSELFFIDYEYDNDGFSLFDFSSGKLLKQGSISH